MKKTYITPKIKTVKIKQSSMLCSSPMNVYSNESVTLETDEETGANIAW